MLLLGFTICLEEYHLLLIQVNYISHILYGHEEFLKTLDYFHNLIAYFPKLHVFLQFDVTDLKKFP